MPRSHAAISGSGPLKVILKSDVARRRGARVVPLSFSRLRSPFALRWFLAGSPLKELLGNHMARAGFAPPLCAPLCPLRFKKKRRGRTEFATGVAVQLAALSHRRGCGGGSWVSGRGARGFRSASPTVVRHRPHFLPQRTQRTQRNETGLAKSVAGTPALCLRGPFPPAGFWGRARAGRLWIFSCGWGAGTPAL